MADTVPPPALRLCAACPHRNSCSRHAQCMDPFTKALEAPSDDR